MYTKRKFNQQVKILHNYYREPVKELVARSGLTKPTVISFLKGNRLRSYNEDKLIEAIIELNEKAQEKRKSLLVRGDQIVQLELALDKEQQSGKSI